MMIAPIKEKELAAFSLTSLERAPVRNLCLQPDLGIPLSYLDMGVYAVPSQPQALAPEDAALVQVDLMFPFPFECTTRLPTSACQEHMLMLSLQPVMATLLAYAWHSSAHATSVVDRS